MSEEKSPTCIFENERVTFKSYSDEFTPELYKEFDLKAKDLGLDSKINDLFTGNKGSFSR